MSLTMDQAKALITMISVYDGREQSKLEAAAWQRASEMGHWTYDEAVPAAQEYYAFETRRMMPGDLTRRIKEIRQDRAMRENAKKLTEQRIEVTGSYLNQSVDWGTTHSPELERLHRIACEQMPKCTACQSEGRCVSKSTGKPLKIPCLPRVKAATSASWVPQFVSACPNCGEGTKTDNVPEHVPAPLKGERGPRVAFLCRACRHRWTEHR